MLLTASSAATPQKPPLPSLNAFSGTVQPFLLKNCRTCHCGKVSTAGLSTQICGDPPIDNNRDLWGLILSKIEYVEMPPNSLPRPDPSASGIVTDWLQAEFGRDDELIGPDLRCCSVREVS
jgi:hypothetical protein